MKEKKVGFFAKLFGKKEKESCCSVEFEELPLESQDDEVEKEQKESCACNCSSK